MSNTYGEWLKAQRDSAGLTQQELAEMAVMTRSHIAHIEAGRRIPSKEDARRLDRALNTGDVLSSFLPEQDVVVADRFESARQLEQQASRIQEFALTLVPGILQTERYMRAVLSTALPPWSEEECDRIVVTRLERAEVLADPVTPVVWVLLDEAVLRREVGGRHVMGEQVAHIASLVESGRVRVHVLPTNLGAHPLQQSMVTLMWFEDQPPVAYSEALYMAKLHDEPAIVERIRTAYDLALGDAMPLNESLTLMKAIAKEYGHDV
ncbi:helix-turn-helix domain-containing protein [Streptomyces oceani]|uniref:DNA-binding protein n=1 Tax=Streptomyces oceani TaxID=1075402 RepID=A0A1E7JVW3_9ACTN|nr:helix-turn-helix transcriptional regulator [Streptomyces oceani]OEU94814.1 DNA-binding protein [Streptomyces oceani]